MSCMIQRFFGGRAIGGEAPPPKCIEEIETSFSTVLKTWMLKKHNSYMKKVLDMEKKTVWTKNQQPEKMVDIFLANLVSVSHSSGSVLALCKRFSVKKVVCLKVGLCVKGAA